jgi:hypothetical protein
MADPTVLLQHTTAITITMPEIITGTNYTALVSGTTQLLTPLDTLANSSASLVATNPVTYAGTLVGNVSVLFSYFNYMQNFIPGLTSLLALFSAYLLVLLIKTVLRVVMYVKQLIAGWL